MDNVIAVSAAVGVSALEDFMGVTHLSMNAVKCATIAAFGVNLFAVQVPGRLDGEVAKAMREQADKGEKINQAASDLLPAVGRTYIAPAGWAFAIWGPIYLGEIIFSAVVPFLKPESAVSEVVKEILPYWISANLFQSLWCATFRPKFHTEKAKRTLGPFVSCLFLGLTARSLGLASLIISTKSSALSWLEKALFVPLKMHCGWTTAATLVNANGALANYKNAGSDRNLYALGCTSVAAAWAASAAVAMKTNDPTYSLVIGWALFAVSSGMDARLASASKGTMMEHASSIRALSKFSGASSLLLAALTYTPILSDFGKK